MLLSLFHLAVTGALVKRLKKPHLPLLQDESLPRVTVLLCLKGNDSHGLDCLRSLLFLNYPHYKIHVVIDREGNPVWQMIPPLLKAYPGVQVELSTLSVWNKNCSFEGNALIQMVQSLEADREADCEVVATIDAGLLPHPDWLREMVSPLGNPQVGVSTGYRWYKPRRGRGRSLIQYAWNGFMVAQMCVSRVPWEGSLAIRTKHIHQIELSYSWQQAITTDVILGKLLRRNGLRIAVVPSLFMTCHIEPERWSFANWVKRRLLLLRVYHPMWIVVAGQGFFVTLTLVRTAILLSFFLFTSRWRASGWVLGGLLTYMSVVALLISTLERNARQAATQRGEHVHRLSFSLLMQLFITIPLAQLSHALATLSTLFVRKLDLQGAAFQIKDLRRVRLVK